jgi:enoyl-CoA hydratase
MPASEHQHYSLSIDHTAAILRLMSPDGTNKLSLSVVRALLACICNLRADAESLKIRRLIITGNDRFFSAGADLNEIAHLTGPEAFEFSRLGQRLMNAIDRFPVPVIAAVSGYCMGGGIDLALACDRRIAAPNAIFGHRGASLGLITGWGGTQRLPRLIGKARALQMFLLAEKVHAHEALGIGLVNALYDDPLSASLACLFEQGNQRSSA